MAGGYELLKMVSGEASVDWGMMAVGMLVAGLTGYACIHLLLKVIERIGLLPFALYRFLIAGLILVSFT